MNNQALNKQTILQKNLEKHLRSKVEDLTVEDYLDFLHDRMFDSDENGSVRIKACEIAMKYKLGVVDDTETVPLYNVLLKSRLDSFVKDHINDNYLMEIKTDVLLEYCSVEVNRENQTIAANVLKENGWELKSKRVNGNVERLYIKKVDNDE